MAEEPLNKEPPQQFSLGRLLLTTVYFGVGFACVRAFAGMELPLFVPIFAGLMGVAAGIAIRRDVGLLFLLGVLVYGLFIGVMTFLFHV